MEILGWVLAVGGVCAIVAGLAGLAVGRIHLLSIRARKQALAYLMAGVGGLVVGGTLLSAPLPSPAQPPDSLASPPAATDAGDRTDSGSVDEGDTPGLAFHESSIEGVGFVAVSGGKLVPPRVLSSEYYPCTECHSGAGEPEFLDRNVDFHEDKAISGHGEPLKWCFDCHNPDNPNTLRLVGGEAIEFKNLDVLCGQCHGKIYAAWQAGAYGKRVGLWDGEKRYFSCTECHDPHQPRFEAITPDPAPLRPEETLR